MITLSVLIFFFSFQGGSLQLFIGLLNKNSESRRCSVFVQRFLSNLGENGMYLHSHYDTSYSANTLEKGMNSAILSLAMG